MKKRTVLVTGSEGLIGQEVVRQLVEHKTTNLKTLDISDRESPIPEVDSFTGDINNPPELLFNGVDTVVHLASVMGVEYTDSNPIQTIETIVNGTRKILELSVKNRVSHFIFASSSEVYGDNMSGPWSEESRTAPKSVYGSAKLTAEYLCRAFQKEYGLDYTIVRIFNTFGKNQSNKFVIPSFIEKALRSEPIEVFGQGDQTRSFCHVADAARGIIKVMESSGTRNKTYNIGDPRNEISVINLARKIIDLVGDVSSKVKLIPLGSNTTREPKREIYYRLPDISALSTATGYQPVEDFSKKLLEMIDDKRDQLKAGKESKMVANGIL
jgi:nucleoside-diphosphate-sugar epimerase